MIRITECPRDAMQGIQEMIPAAKKAAYINQLLRAGFDVIDAGSFVSPKTIPQMADTGQVLSLIDTSGSDTKLLAIVANARGALEACMQEKITYLGFPFSISETFQRRNTNSGIDESLERVKEIINLCNTYGKQLRIYISMAFGNPYGDPYSPDVAIRWCGELSAMGIRQIALADTVGSSDAEGIRSLFYALTKEFPSAELIAHLHSRPEHAAAKIMAAYEGGCRSFDVAIHGYGGCPMAGDELTGNIATETLVAQMDLIGVGHSLDREELKKAYLAASEIFNAYH